MQIPSSTFAVVAFVVLFVPGFVFAVVRIWMRGFRADDKGIDTRIAQALVVSVIFDAFYLLLVYQWLKPEVKVTASNIEILNSAPLGATILIGFVLLPGIVAAVAYRPWTLRRVADAKPDAEQRAALRGSPADPGQVPKRAGSHLRWVRRWRYSSVPTAWDWAAGDPANRFIRILLPDKRWVGGFYGPNSYVSTYPEPRDIFISMPCKFDNSGNFAGGVPGSLGMWLTIPDGAIVDFVDPKYKPPAEEEVK